MKKVFLMVLLMSVLPLTAQAQLYNDKHDEMVSTMDRAASDADATYANVDVAGAKEDAMPQGDHYDYLTQPMNEANERHFDASAQTETVTEIENKQK
jgi:hypothetical protein